MVDENILKLWVLLNHLERVLVRQKERWKKRALRLCIIKPLILQTMLLQS